MRRGYQGITIPLPMEVEGFRSGMLEMDDPEHRIYRTALNPYLSPAAVARWEPFADEVVRACLDEKIESGRIDFVDDLANIVPAVLTLALLGIPLDKCPSTTSRRTLRCTRRRISRPRAGAWAVHGHDPRPVHHHR